MRVGVLHLVVRLADLPLMREQLLDMLLDVEAMTSLFFEGSAQLAAADAGDD